MSIITLFRNAGATGHVFCLKNGKVREKGLAFSGLIGPQTTVAVVPTTMQILDFAVEARTQDKQSVTVAGNLKVVLIPAEAVRKFDFTVDVKDGSYVQRWESDLRTVVVAQVIAPIHDAAATLDVEEATRANASFEKLIEERLRASDGALSGSGITVNSCSISRITANDDKVARAIGAKEREALLTAADHALSERRLKSAEDDRRIRTFEAETALKLEEERAKLLAKAGENKRVEAEADAEATRLRLEPFKNADAGKVLGASIMRMAENGRVGNLSIVPDMIAALNQK